MAIEDSLAVTGASAAEAKEPFSAAWWECRTAEELRDIIKRGFAGGQAFEDAVAEAERRARVETRRLREAAAQEAASRHRRNLLILGAAGIASAIAIAAMWIFA